MMPHCLVHATLTVQKYFLEAGVESASDLAGWWCNAAEAQVLAGRKGWGDEDTGAR